MNVGQHNGADYCGLLSLTILATPKEYDSLLQELISIGYDDLQIRKRWTKQRANILIDL